MKFNLASVTASAVLGLASLTSNATTTLLDFTIQEGSVPGSATHQFVADKVNGGYSAVLTINPDFSFIFTAVADFGQFFKDDGGTLVSPTQINGFGTGGYGMYGVLTSVGQLVGGSVFVGLSGSFNLFIDADQDTTKTLGATGFIPPTIANNADDYLIASSTSLAAGLGFVGDPGAFDYTFDNFTLTPAGAGYFIAPHPFHMVVNVDGDFDNFTPIASTFTTVGDVSAVFQVPEPSSLALAGLGLLGLAASQRRRQAKK